MENFTCDICHESFRHKYLLQRHMDGEHLGKKPFQCSECGKRYSRKDNAGQHIKRRCPKATVVKVVNDEPPATCSSITVGEPHPFSSTDAEE